MPTDLTNDDLTRLRAVAELATAGKRSYFKSRVSTETQWIAGARDSDAPHIAAFDRETCLALLDEVERLRRVEAAARVVLVNFTAEHLDYASSTNCGTELRRTMTPPESKP